MNKKPPRRSIVSSFSAFAGPASPQPEAGEDAPERKSGFDLARLSARPAARVGAGVIGATQRTLTDIREERDRLLAQVEAGGVIEVDPAAVDPSPLPDRLPDDDASAFEALKRSLAEEGQKVPVELRRHPAKPGRYYQLVYGHRRWRAAQELGIRLKAIVGDLDDRPWRWPRGSRMLRGRISRGSRRRCSRGGWKPPASVRVTSARAAGGRSRAREVPGGVPGAGP